MCELLEGIVTVPQPGPNRCVSPLRSKPRDGGDEPCSPTPPTEHQHQSGHLMCYEGRTSSRAIDTRGPPSRLAAGGRMLKCRKRNSPLTKSLRSDSVPSESEREFGCGDGSAG